MEIIAKLTLLYVLAGVVAGTISGFFIRSGWHGLFLAIAFFLVVFRFAPHALKIARHQFPGGQRRIATSGILPFFLIWLIVWIAVYTYL